MLVIASFVLGYVLSVNLKDSKENSGERLVIQTIHEGFSREKYHLLNNVTLPTSDGGTTQIDHILVSKYGVFVIETKDYSGWIFGSKNSKKWTQSFPARKYQFQNPLHQNQKHIHELVKLFDFMPKSAFKSLVVFTNRSQFKTRKPENVIYINQLKNYIYSFRVEEISQNRVFFVVGKINVLRREVSEQTDQLHIEYLKNKFIPQGV